MGVSAADPDFWDELMAIHESSIWVINDELDVLTQEPSLDRSNTIEGENGICELRVADVDALGGIFYARRGREVILLALWLVGVPDGRVLALGLARSRRGSSS